MKEYLISLFMDDELDLDRKIELIEAVSLDGNFKKETIDLLRQEKLLRSDMVDFVPPVVIEKTFSPKYFLSRAVGLFCSGLAVALIVFFVWFTAGKSTPDPRMDLPVPYRFVIFQPGIARAEITGSFTRWQVVPMVRNGDYWEITLDLPHGEHRFSYIFDGQRKVADPTVPIREKDDFGGENSILEVRQAS